MSTVCYVFVLFQDIATGWEKWEFFTPNLYFKLLIPSISLQG